MKCISPILVSSYLSLMIIERNYVMLQKSGNTFTPNAAGKQQFQF